MVTLMHTNDSSNSEQTAKPKILELAEKVPDPRIDRCKKHPLASMIFVALVGTVCGADDWVAISDTGK